ncbi:MAG TPA: hypothetical protein HA345_07090 [Candidatus Thalassarchaeaceae archaeon]|nr:hypothetical protein [Candidatus Thalassarchaeaceae archaeon]
MRDPTMPPDFPSWTPDDSDRNRWDIRSRKAIIRRTRRVAIPHNAHLVIRRRLRPIERQRIARLKGTRRRLLQTSIEFNSKFQKRWC